MGGNGVTRGGRGPSHPCPSPAEGGGGEFKVQGSKFKVARGVFPGDSLRSSPGFERPHSPAPLDSRPWPGYHRRL